MHYLWVKGVCFSFLVVFEFEHCPVMLCCHQVIELMSPLLSMLKVLLVTVSDARLRNSSKAACLFCRLEVCVLVPLPRSVFTTIGSDSSLVLSPSLS